MSTIKVEKALQASNEKKSPLYYSFWTNEAQLTVKHWNASKFRIPTSGPVFPFFLPPLFYDRRR